MRPRETFAALVACCALFVHVFVWFYWETKNGNQGLWEDKPFWLAGSLLAASLVVAAAACAFLASGPRPKRASRFPRTPRPLRVAGGGFVVSLGLALVLCRVVSLHVIGVGRAPPGEPEPWARWTGQADVNGDGAEDKWDRARALKWHALQLGWDAMVPLALLGVPVQQFSPALRALGLPHEAGIAIHRALGWATLALVLGHGLLYMLAWGVEGGWTKVGDEALQVCHHGPRVTEQPPRRAFRNGCRGVSNFFGLLAVCSGAAMAVASLAWVRRRRYAWFLLAHQLHFAWWFFAALHYPGTLVFAAPSLIFFLADVARRHASETPRRCASAVRDGVATVRVPISAGDDATGGVLRLRVRAISPVWHPFSVAAVVEDACIVTVFATGPWTTALCRLAASGSVELEARGPIPPPPDVALRARSAAR
eukprot:CAMPEP_0119264446 /NCGR_PEP_ID=MMETSP1329-20130426/3522_1 /TAXON_ID=114041 /ORGANISM="Genus nov. species nov., Strain RCC1024" /LENGTH=423 /DNA_ID=CAMNT_0007264213 /DNA_START=159 /DNA_END=1426 /DNA_ORIENTATION=-